MPAKIAIDRGNLAEFCRRNGIRKLSIFGSVLRDDFRPDSDVDVLVEFDPEQIPGLMRFVQLEEELSFHFGGRKVDLLTPKSISPYFRTRVLQEAEILYGEV